MNISFNRNIKNDLDYFIGKATNIKFIITDAQLTSYESEIIMPINWKRNELVEIIKDALLMCEAKPVKIFVDSITENVSVLN
jgi:hypothetical protein